MDFENDSRASLLLGIVADVCIVAALRGLALAGSIASLPVVIVVGLIAPKPLLVETRRAVSGLLDTAKTGFVEALRRIRKHDV